MLHWQLNGNRIQLELLNVCFWRLRIQRAWIDEDLIALQTLHDYAWAKDTWNMLAYDIRHCYTRRNLLEQRNYAGNEGIYEHQRINV
jgi:hypothetical protein